MKHGYGKNTLYECLPKKILNVLHWVAQYHYHYLCDLPNSIKMCNENVYIYNKKEIKINIRYKKKWKH